MSVYSYLPLADMLRHTLIARLVRVLCMLLRGGRFVPVLCLWGVCICVLTLAGCAPKNLTVEDLPAETGRAEQDRGSIHLPSDDGKPLSPEELDALISVGDFDRNVRGEDMREVVLHFKFYVHQARRTVERNVERGEIFLPHIRGVLSQKKLPGELAYLPFIESGYNTEARSRTGALGMWQFVRGTGTYYGMKRDWWSDERYDPYQSTDAATEYLSKLNGMFKNWHLAITAYNAGEGRVSRAMSAAGAKDYFDLRRRNDSVPEKDRLTEENQQYLPRFLAICKIMRNLDALGFRAPDSGKARNVAEISVRPATDLMALAAGLGMSWNEFSSYNPAYLRYISPPDRTSSIYVPKSMSAQARSLVSKNSGGAGWRTYTVRKGDTMARIAKRSSVPVAELRRVNQVNEPLKVGKLIRIPGSEGSAASQSMAEVEPERRVGRVASGSRTSSADSTSYGPSGRTHIVQGGDTLFGLSRTWGVPVDAIADVNRLSSSTLKLGQKLFVPGTQEQTRTLAARSGRENAASAKVVGAKTQKAPAASTRSTSAVKRKASTTKAQAVRSTPATAKQAAPRSAADKKKSVSYTVQPGDTVWAIARKFDVAPTELLRANNMTRDVRLRPGDAMRVVLNDR